MHLSDERKILLIITSKYDLLVDFDVLSDLTERPHIVWASSAAAEPPGQHPEKRRPEYPAQGFDGLMIRASIRCSANVIWVSAMPVFSARKQQGGIKPQEPAGVYPQKGGRISRSK